MFAGKNWLKIRKNGHFNLAPVREAATPPRGLLVSIVKKLHQVFVVMCLRGANSICKLKNL